MRIPTVLLALLIASALLVRIWGCAYGNLNSGNHDEQIHLSTALQIYNGEISIHNIWVLRHENYVLYPWFGMYLVAFVFYLYTTLGNLMASIIPGMGVGSGGLTHQEALLIGRLAVAVFGVWTVAIVYSIGKLLSRDRWISLLAAAFMAFNVSHVANCHWLKNDIIAVFFLSLAFLYAAKISILGRDGYYILAGIFSALAILSKYNTFPVVIVVILAHLSRGEISIRGLLRSMVTGKIYWFYLFFIMIFIAAWPLIYIDFTYFRSRVLDWIIDAPRKHLFSGVDKYADPRGFFSSRLINVIQFFLFSIDIRGGMGLYCTLLGIGGGILTFQKRRRRYLILFVFPVIYMAMMVLLASAMRYQDIMPVYPFISLLAAFFLKWVLGVLLSRPGIVRLASLLAGVFILIPSIKNVVGMDYGYWVNCAQFLGTYWAERNIPPTSKFAYESRTISLDRSKFRGRKIRRLWGEDVEQLKRSGFDYLVTTSRHEHRALERYGLFGPDHAFGQFYLSLPLEYDQIKSFDMGIIPYKGGYPNIYQLKKDGTPCDSGLNSSLLLHFQNDYVLSSPDILFLNELGQCEGESSSVISVNASLNKLLISPVELPELGVQLVNSTNQVNATLCSGARSIKVHLPPGGSKQVILRSHPGFPYIKNSYRVTANSSGDNPLLVRIFPDIFRIGLGFYNLNQWGQAINFLEMAHYREPGDWYILYLLSRAYQHAGMVQKSASSFERAKRLFPEISAFIGDLSDPNIKDDEWNRSFRRWTGFEPAWLEKRVGFQFPLNRKSVLNSEFGHPIWKTPDFYLLPGRYIIRLIFLEDKKKSSPSVYLYCEGQLDREWLPRAGEINPGMEFLNKKFGSKYFLTIQNIDTEGTWPEKILIVPALRHWFGSAFLDYPIEP